MECCDQEMELIIDAVIDEYEPITGHKQTEVKPYWFCEDCGNVEIYIKEETK